MAAAAGFGPDDDLYALLGVSVDSTTKEISSAYRKKARDVHPDKNPSADAGAHARLDHGNRSADTALCPQPCFSTSCAKRPRCFLTRRRARRTTTLSVPSSSASSATRNSTRSARSCAMVRRSLCSAANAHEPHARPDLLERERQARDKKSTEEEARRVFEEQLARMRADAKSQKRPAFDMDMDLSDDDDSTSAPKKDAAPASPAAPPSAFTDMDRTVQLRWDARAGTYDEAAISRLLRQFGPVDMLVINKKGTNALVAFSSILDAVRGVHTVALVTCEAHPSAWAFCSKPSS